MDTTAQQPLLLSLQEVKRLALAWQGLYPPRSWKGKQGVKSYFQRVRSIQYDPINVVGRNPDLVLQSRVLNYQPSQLQELLYKDRMLVDSWDKKASISLTEDWPYFSRCRAGVGEVFGVPSDLVMELAPTILEQIEKEGPQSSLEFKIEKKTNWGWGPTRVVRACLEALYKTGRLGVHHRINSRRYFDLIENLLPEELLNTPDPNQSLEAYQRWHVLRRIGAMGLAHANAGDHWGGMIGIKSPRRREILQELTAAGEIVTIEIPELHQERFYMRRGDLSLARESLETQTERAAAFIAPLDNLLWDRKTLQRLFSFSYSWEVYKPKSQREYGFYTLPVLYGDAFVGRFDSSLDRKSGKLTVHNWWWERGVQIDQELVNALEKCWGAFLAYLNAEDVMVSKETLQEGNLEWLKDF